MKRLKGLEETTNELVETNNEISSIEYTISTKIAKFNEKLNSLKRQEFQLKELIKNAMAKNGVKKFENDNIALTYIAPTIRKSLDTQRLKKEEPDIYDYFLKSSEVKDSVRIKIKTK